MSLWSRAFSVIGPFALVLLLILTGTVQGYTASSASGGFVINELIPATDSGGAVPVNLTLNSTGYTLSPFFWGTTISPRAELFPGEGQLINATPTEVVLWPGAQAGEDYNPINNSIYTTIRATGSSPAMHYWDSAPTSEAQFVSWCKSINCAAIFQVPAETSNLSMALWVVNYTENTLDFHPAFWEIGNEPQLWKLAGIPWTEWPVGTASGPSQCPCGVVPASYAWTVRNFTAAMRSVDPNIQIIGLPAAGRPDPKPVTAWAASVVQVDGNQTVGIGYHDYPAGGGGRKAPPATLQTFYSAINGSAGLVGRVDQIREGISIGSTANGTVCPTNCSRQLGIYVTEFGDALSHKPYGHWAAEFPGALDYAAQVTQAIDLNVTNIDVFAAVLGTNNSWMSLEGEPHPSYTLFSEILNHLGNEAYQVALTVPSQYTGSNTTLGGNLYGVATIDTRDSNRTDLMVVNLNATTNVTFSPRLPGGIAPRTPTEVWEWQGNVSNPDNNWATARVNPLTSEPVAQYFPSGLPTNWTLPLQSVALFESFPGGGAPVQLNATGFTGTYAHPRWFATVGGVTYTANETGRITYFLPHGSYALSSTPIQLKNGIPLARGNIELYARERLEPFLPATISVDSKPVNVTIVFAHQWATNISLVSTDPQMAGSVSPAPHWWNATTQLSLAAHPAFGYLFTNWVEVENLPGNVTITNVTGVSPTTDPWVNGSLRVNASFARAYPVTFTENGLAPGTVWSLNVRTSWNDTTNETYHLQTSNTTWDNTSTVTTSTTFDNETFSSMTGTLALEEPNGTYAFSVGAVDGYRSLPVSANLTIAGGQRSVAINFTKETPWFQNYSVTFLQSGLRSGTPWWITVRNVTLSSTSQTLMFDGNHSEPNGSYGYVARTLDGFQPHPPASGFVVDGPGLEVSVVFAPVRYDVVWEETGLGNVSWSVNVEGQPIGSVGAWTTARLTNGSYTFTIPNVLDYIPQLRSGNFTVAGAGGVFLVQFLPASYTVMFKASGVPANDPWLLRLANVTHNVTGLSMLIYEPNGTYTFNVTPPAGFIAVPSHGVITVDAASMVVTISFGLLGPLPDPPIWNLAIPAIVATAVIALAGWGTFALVGGRKRRRSGAKP